MCHIISQKDPYITERLLADPRIDLDMINPNNQKTALQLAQERGATERGRQHLALITDKIAARRRATAAEQHSGGPVLTRFTISLATAVPLSNAVPPAVAATQGNQAQNWNEMPGCVLC